LVHGAALPAEADYEVRGQTKRSVLGLKLLCVLEGLPPGYVLGPGEPGFVGRSSFRRRRWW